MYCSKCGSEMKEGSKFCGVCGKQTGVALSQQPASQTSQDNWASSVPHTPEPNTANGGNPAPLNVEQTGSWLMANAKCVPAFVLGLIAGIMGILGGSCMATCGSAMSSSLSNLNGFMILFPSIIGLVGACLCYKHAHIGSILMLIPGVTILIKGWFMYGGADIMSIFAMLLFWIGGFVGLAMTRQSK